MHTDCVQCGSPVPLKQIRCTRCARLNGKHPVIVAAMVSMALATCASISFVVYVSIHRDQFPDNGSGRPPAIAPATGYSPRIADEERTAEPKFFQK